MNAVYGSSLQTEIEKVKTRLNILDSFGTEITERLLSTYFSSSLERFENIKRSLVDVRLEIVKKELHDLKSTSFNIGAEWLGEKFRSMEGIKIAENPLELTTSLNEAESFFIKLRDCFRDENA